MNPQDIFVARLRRYRQRNGIPLEQVALATRIKPELIEAFEQNDLSRWPNGVYARAWVRAYSAAIGMDPNGTVEEFCRLFPQGDRRNSSVIQEMAAIVAHPPEYRDDLGGTTGRRRRATDVVPSPDVSWQVAAGQWWAALRARLAAIVLPVPRLRRTPRPTP